MAKKTVKKATKKAKRSVKKATRPTGLMPQRSAATKKGGARPEGKRSNRGIEQTWVELFRQNEKSPKNRKMTDAEISKEMHGNFPGRNSGVFDNVTGVRSKLNRGGFSGTCDKMNITTFTSQRYDEDGNIIEKGKRKAASGKSVKGKATKKVTRPAKKAKRPTAKK